VRYTRMLCRLSFIYLVNNRRMVRHDYELSMMINPFFRMVRLSRSNIILYRINEVSIEYAES